MKVMDEAEFVLESFQKNFAEKSVSPLVIYGLGKNTKEIIDAFPNAEIVGLMDEVRTGDTVFGKKVLNFDEVLAFHVHDILILARPANIQIIYRRIKAFTEENHITVYDINGTVLGTPDDDYVLPDDYRDMTEEKLRQKVEAADVVSFDIFDTLVVRDCLYPTDLFLQLHCEGHTSDEIRQCRMKAERELYLETNPTIREIYERMEKAYGFTDKQCQELMAQEIQLENEHIFPRRTMVDIFRNIKKEKPVFLTSDMYLTKNILLPILQKNGIDVSEEQLLISCEEKTSKSEHLYTRLQELNPGKKILHIGDDVAADVRAAKHAGIEETFFIRSVYGMLEDSRVRALLDDQDDMYQRRMTAKFANYHFDNPFLLSRTAGKPVLYSEYQMGCFFLAPILICFVKWMLHTMKKEGIRHILLGARDGYLLVKIFDLLKEYGVDVPDYRYLYASRAVCLLAAIYDEQDILYVASLAFAGSAEEMLQQRFRLKKEQLHERNGESDEQYILNHKEAILENAEGMRERYRRYLNTALNEGMTEKEEYAFFDFVSAGNCQLGLEKILKKELTGIYFSQVYDSRQEHLKIFSMYPEKFVYEPQEAPVNNYFLLENIMTSFEATLYDFDDCGNPLFYKENRSKRQLAELSQIHQGILQAVEDELHDGWNETFDIASAGRNIQILNTKYIQFDMTYFADNQMEDAFCNRVFDLSADMV